MVMKPMTGHDESNFANKWSGCSRKITRTHDKQTYGSVCCFTLRLQYAFVAEQLAKEGKGTITKISGIASTN
jgi:hypothetical protein